MGAYRLALSAIEEKLRREQGGTNCQKAIGQAIDCY